MSEEDKPYYTHILQRDYEKERYEDLSPFSLHLQREGEPLYPRAPRHGHQQRELAELSRELARWQSWAEAQPDATMLLSEQQTFSRLQLSPFKLSEVDAQELYEKWQKEAQKVRKAGHGEIIEKYWPHLSKPLSPNR